MFSECLLLMHMLWVLVCFMSLDCTSTGLSVSSSCDAICSSCCCMEDMREVSWHRASNSRIDAKSYSAVRAFSIFWCAKERAPWSRLTLQYRWRCSRFPMYLKDWLWLFLLRQKGHALIMSFAISGCFCQSFGRSAGK